MVTTGAMTKRVDRLEAAGLVSRRPAADDGRGRVVALTEKGRETIDRAFEAHVANEHRLAGMLDPADRAALEPILRAWLRRLQ
jgi:DNA-binding MarR family transcriptional regulator